MRFARSEWTESAAVALRTALACDVEIIASQVRRGVAQLWRIDNGSYFVVRKEADACVIVAYEGSQLREITPYIIECARRSGCSHIRFHTTRPALIRLLRRFNPEPMEYVVRLPIGRTH